MTARKKEGTLTAGKGNALTVRKRTLRDLTAGGHGPKGGWIRPPISWSCPQPSPSGANCNKAM